jgi:hypothetical protein
MRTIQLLFMAFLTWVITNGIAATLYIISAAAGFEFDPFLCKECYGTLSIVLIFGLIFSAPFTIFLPVIFIVIERTETIEKRLLLSALLIGALCMAVIVAFITFFGTDEFSPRTVIAFLIPYIIGALASFVLVGRKLIFHRATSSLTITDHLINDHES